MASEDRKMEVEETKHEEVEKKSEEKEEEKKDDGPSVLDLAFAMDCTGSMGSYIHQARQVSVQTFWVQSVNFVIAEIDAKLHWRIYIQKFPTHAPLRHPILSFSHTFSPKAPTSEVHPPTGNPGSAPGY